MPDRRGTSLRWLAAAATSLLVGALWSLAHASTLVRVHAPPRADAPVGQLPATSVDIAAQVRVTPVPRPAPVATRHPAVPRGILLVAPGMSEVVGEGPNRRFRVEVETATGVDPASFAADVERILFDPRSWTAHGRATFRRVEHGPVELTVTLTTPDTTDELCLPLDTENRYSCWSSGRAVINASRWEHGAASYADDLEAYRAYLVNHEVGHGLGHEHVPCRTPGSLAPIMLQQSYGLDGCRPNPWPYPDSGTGR